jgi:hypothetical protein
MILILPDGTLPFLALRAQVSSLMVSQECRPAAPAGHLPQLSQSFEVNPFILQERCQSLFKAIALVLRWLVRRVGISHTSPPTQ